jgi:glycosyltransferase involved in cell wall biosynthesis
MDEKNPMVRLYIHHIQGLHHKNRSALLKGLQQCDTVTVVDTLNEADWVYSPRKPLPIHVHPTKKFIFGPHFSVFPNHASIHFNNQHNNAIYIVPSHWCQQLWQQHFKYQGLPMRVYPFGVDVDRFAPIESQKKKTKILIYVKRRRSEDVKYVLEQLSQFNVDPKDYKIFDYLKRYDENQFLHFLRHEAYMAIWIGAHESQGFAVLEALACDVPLLVWTVSHMKQESPCPRSYAAVSTEATTIPYWNETYCGHAFHEKEEFLSAWQTFHERLPNYQPRHFVIERAQLTIPHQMQALIDLFEKAITIEMKNEEKDNESEEKDEKE